MTNMWLNVMIKIAHRGNINGKSIELENTISYLVNALDKGYDVECDVRIIDGNYYLGHDEPQEMVDISFFTSNVWVHAKNIETYLSLFGKCENLFFHTYEHCVLTTSNKIWTLPGQKLSENSIQVMPEYVGEAFNKNVYGICTDFVSEIK